MKKPLKLSTSLTLLTLIPLGLLGAIITNKPANARNQFDVCVEQMINSGISAEKAGTACAGALIPKELSQCVRQIRNNIDLPAESVLENCYRVRRPVDLANCVVDINADFPVKVTTATKQTDTETRLDEASETTFSQPNDNSLAMQVLESCRRSLLPGRYSECVTATNRSAGDSPEQALKTCLAAEDFPRDIFPAYHN